MYNLIDARGATWYRGTGIGTYTYNLLKIGRASCRERV